MSERSSRQTVRDVDHTHPHTDEPFGSSGVYERGTDDQTQDDAEGERVPADVDDEGATDRVRTRGSPNRGAPQRVKDLDHTPPDEVGAQRAFERGEETPDEGDDAGT